MWREQSSIVWFIKLGHVLKFWKVDGFGFGCCKTPLLAPNSSRLVGFPEIAAEVDVDRAGSWADQTSEQRAFCCYTFNQVYQVFASKSMLKIKKIWNI